MNEGMRLRGNQPTEREGVRAVQGVFEDANFTFQEVDARIDIGKDAYIDLAVGDRFRGNVIAAQIKSGASYRNGADYKIPADRDHRALWAGSNIPIYGFVYDPDTERVHWIVLSTWARGLKVGDTRSYCHVPAENVLSWDTLLEFVRLARSEMRQRNAEALLEVFSADERKQPRAVYDCLALGRTDPRGLLLLRAALRWLTSQNALWGAIQVLSFATPHPDIGWTSDTWLPDEIKAPVVDSFRWSEEEVSLLLSAPTGDMWQRGDLGMAVFMLLTADPDIVPMLERVAINNAQNEDVAWPAVMVGVHLAGEGGLPVVERLLEEAGGLAAIPAVRELHGTLREHGHVSMW